MTPEALVVLMIAHAVQILVAFGVVTLIIRLMPSSHPRFIFGLWLIVLIKCLLPPVIPGPFSSLSGLRGSNSPETSGSEFTAEEFASGESTLVVMSDIDLERASDRSSVKQMLPGHPQSESTLNKFLEHIGSTITHSRSALESWITTYIGRRGIIFLLLLLATGAVHRLISTIIHFSRSLRDIRQHHNEGLSQQLQHRVDQLSQQLKLKRVPQVVVSDSLYGPAVMGLLRKVIVIPACLVTSQSSATLDPILAHELLHIRRNDLWTGFLQTIAQTLWWFHPAVKSLNDQLTHSIEQCCDEAVISELGCSRSAYARCLLAVIERKHKIKPVPVLPGMKPVEITSLRMERIMKTRTRKISPQLKMSYTALLLIIAVLTLPGLGSQGKAIGSQQTEQPKEVRRPLRQAVLAPARREPELLQLEQRVSPDSVSVPNAQTRELEVSMLLLKGTNESVSALIEQISNTSDKDREPRQLSDLPVVLEQSDQRLIWQLLNGSHEPPQDLEVISRPRIRVFDGASGIVQIGSHRPKTDKDPSESSVSEQEETGLWIELAPALAADGKVNLHLSMKLTEQLEPQQITLISDTGNESKANTDPQTRQTRISTDFSMQTNQAAVVRGKSEPAPPSAGEILLVLRVDLVDQKDQTAEVELAPKMTVRAYALSDLGLAAGRRINNDIEAGGYAPLMEFIRSATGGSRNWSDALDDKTGGRMTVDTNSQTLVVQHTDEVHAQITSLLRTLRESRRQVVIQCTLFSLPSNDSSLGDWINENLKFQTPVGSRPWTQLTPDQEAEFLKEVEKDRTASQLIAPRLTVFDNQKAEIRTQFANSPNHGELSIGAQPSIRGDEVIELAYEVAIAGYIPQAAPQTALLLNDQTLIVHLEPTSTDQSKNAPGTSHYLMFKATLGIREAEEILSAPEALKK